MLEVDLRVIDLWLTDLRHRKGRKADPLLRQMREGHELYRVAREARAERIVEFTRSPSYRAAYLAAALRPGGILAVVVTEDSPLPSPESVVPYKLAPRASVRLLGGLTEEGAESLMHTPASSCDMVAVESGVPDDPWLNEGLRLLRHRGALHIAGHPTNRIEFEPPGIEAHG